MQIRFQHSPEETRQMDTQQLRTHFLVEGLMQSGNIKLVYSHYDRMIIGGVVPSSGSIGLPNEGELKANFFLERREMGIINIGGKGTVSADGTAYDIDKLECVYLGKGTKDVSFSSSDQKNPAAFYLLSTPAHHVYPNKKMTKQDAAPLQLLALIFLISEAILQVSLLRRQISYLPTKRYKHDKLICSFLLKRFRKTRQYRYKSIKRTFQITVFRFIFKYLLPVCLKPAGPSEWH